MSTACSSAQHATGPPGPRNAGRDIFTETRYRVSGSGTLNVAYDLWLHNIPNPDWPDNPTDEIMIWTYRAGGAGPLGTLQGTVTIAGTNWDLYRGNIGWNVFSLVRRTNTTAATLHLQDFLGNPLCRPHTGLRWSKPGARVRVQLRCTAANCAQLQVLQRF